MPPVRIGRALAILLIALPLSGCGGSNYELTLEPKGESLSRTLVYSEGNPAEDTEEPEAAPPEPSAEVARLAAVFKIEVPQTVDGNYRFAGNFTGATPDDVGGAGQYARKETSLGALCIYVERFRGSYELAEIVERRFEKVEMLTSLLAHWVRTTGKESPLRNRLEQVVREELPRDLKNVVLLAMTLDQAEGEQDEEQFLMHLGQYLAEREYLNLDMVLKGASGGDSEANALYLLQHSILLKLELSEAELLKTWPALATLETFKASLNEAIETTDAYRQYVERRTEESEGEEVPEGSQLLGTLLAEMIGLEFAAGDSVNVTLQCPHEPLLSNGEWSAEEGRVTWEMQLSKRGSTSMATPPDLCYAIWSEPDSEFQQQHFGKVLLVGELLATYCTWRVSLEAEEGAEWDRFIEAFAGGENLEEAVSEFKFSGSQESQSPAAQQMESIRGLFKKSLGDESE